MAKQRQQSGFPTSEATISIQLEFQGIVRWAPGQGSDPASSHFQPWFSEVLSFIFIIVAIFISLLPLIIAMSIMIEGGAEQLTLGTDSIAF